MKDIIQLNNENRCISANCDYTSDDRTIEYEFDSEEQRMYFFENIQYFTYVNNELVEMSEEEKETLFPPMQPQPTEQEKINAMLMLEIVKLKSSNVPLAISIVDNSILLETLKSYYALGLFNDEDIKMFVLVGDITQEDYQEITNKEYK